MNSIKKKLITGIFVSVLLVSCSTALAAGKPETGGGNGSGKGSSQKGEKAAVSQSAEVIQSQTSNQDSETVKSKPVKNQNNAGQMANNENGQKTSGQASYKNIPLNHNNVGALKKISKYLGLETAGLNPSEISDALATAVEALDSDALAALTEKLKIDTTNMTEKEIIAAIEKKLTPPGNRNRELDIFNQIAIYLDIDIKDLPPEEVANAINAAVDALDSNGLAALAEKLEIDTTDMTTEEIAAAIKAKIAPLAEQVEDGLNEIAEYLDIDITDLTIDEVAAAINAAIEALDSDGLAALAEKLEIDTTVMTVEEIKAAIEDMLAALTVQPIDPLNEIAEYLDIDITNLTPEEVANAINAAIETLDTDGLAALAEKLEIDTTDMTTEDIVSAIGTLLAPPTEQ